MPTTDRRNRVLLLVLGLVVTLPMAGIFGYKWLFQDEPDRAAGCRTRSGGYGTCYEGETVNMWMTLVAGGLALLLLLLLVATMRRWRRADERAAGLLATGARASGHVARLTETNTRIDGRRVQVVEMLATAPDGSTVRCVCRTRYPPPEGTPVTLAYDPGDPGGAVVVEDIEALAHADWNRRIGATQAAIADPAAFAAQQAEAFMRALRENPAAYPDAAGMLAALEAQTPPTGQVPTTDPL